MTITTGTDWFMPVNGGMPYTHEEIATLVEDVGLSPAEALAAATRNSARALGIADGRGTVVPGKAADLLVLDASPLKDIHNITKIRFVVKDGKLIRP